jgi:hypothetical protein
MTNRKSLDYDVLHSLMTYDNMSGSVRARFRTMTKFKLRERAADQFTSEKRGIIWLANFELRTFLVVGGVATSSCHQMNRIFGGRIWGRTSWIISRDCNRQKRRMDSARMTDSGLSSDQENSNQNSKKQNKDEYKVVGGHYSSFQTSFADLRTRIAINNIT